MPMPPSPFRGLLLAGLLFAAPAMAQAPSAALPEGMARFVQTRPECFEPGEKDSYDAWIDSQRIAVPGCASGVVPPSRIIQSARNYKEGSNRTYDCTTMRQNEFSTRFLDTFLDELVALTDRRGKGAKQAAICASNMIYTWAAADAMTENGDQGGETQSKLDRMWHLGGISAAYLYNPAVQAHAGATATPDGTQRETILRWFHTLSTMVATDMDAAKAEPPFKQNKAHVPPPRSRETNLQYWRAFAILPTGLLTGDPALVRQSGDVFTRALKLVTHGEADPAQDGFLPLELRRGNKSLHYQSYAALPLVGLATLSRAHGCDFLDKGWKRDRLAAMMERTLQGAVEPDIFMIEAQRRNNGKQTKQQMSYSVRHSRDLMFLVNRLDPALFTRINDELAVRLDTPPPVIGLKVGAKAGNDRLGGRYRSLADASAALADVPVPGLAGVCAPR